MMSALFPRTARIFFVLLYRYTCLISVIKINTSRLLDSKYIHVPYTGTIGVNNATTRVRGGRSILLPCHKT